MWSSECTPQSVFGLSL
uniref:Uncharacterized protein n=1 Tax=Anguilla anguilla TaxID=7936 RepID=A0A0E9SG52_ANGAN